MYSLPSAPEDKERKCEIKIGEVNFIKEPPLQIEIDIENFGNEDCNMKGTISIRPSTTPDWTEVSVVWKPTTLPPGGTSSITFKYEWLSGAIYFIKVITDKEKETMAYGKAP